MAVRTNPTLTTDLHVGSGEVVDKVHLLWPHAYHGHTCHGHTYYRPACILPACMYAASAIEKVCGGRCG